MRVPSAGAVSLISGSGSRGGDRGVVVHLWDDGVLGTVRDALGRARSGEPAVVCVQGAAGMGKTSLLDELASEAADFVLLSAEGAEDDRSAYSVLGQWGVSLPEADGGIADPFAAAQRLRVLVDGTAGRPLLLRLDDLHWADPESVASVLWLLRRTTCERLLVAVGTRPLAAGQHPGWQRWLAGHRGALRVELAGLSADQVATIIAARGGPADDGLAIAMREHTGGNPLYLTALLDEYGPGDLAARRVLPAPAAFSATIARRTARLPAASVALLASISVLGSSPQPLAVAAAVAQLPDPLPALERLSEAGLAVTRTTGSGAFVRVTHSLVRAACYEQLPLSERRELHARAAQAVAGQAQELDHRLAAASSYDDSLADDLEACATRLRSGQEWRSSADYLRAASSVTSGAALRRRRWLESILDTVLIPDLATARAELAAHPATSDPAEIVVRAFIDLADRHPGDPAATLPPVLALPRDRIDDLTRYRAGVLLATALFDSVRPSDEADRVLQDAEGLGIHDPCVLLHARYARTFIEQKLLPIAEHWSRVDPQLGPPTAVPASGSYELARRAIIATRAGFFETVRDDLAELMRRLRLGMSSGPLTRIPDGLGMAQWMLGDWTAARVSLHLAEELAPGQSIYLPLLLIGEGRFDEADAITTRLFTGWRQHPRDGLLNPLDLYLRVLRAHAEGDQQAMHDTGTAALHEISAGLARPIDIGWVLAAGQAALWAGRADLAASCALQLRAIDPAPSWLAPAAGWIEGLAAGQAGDHGKALAMIRASASDPGLNIPLYQAHMLADHARLALVTGETAAARDSLARAERIYTRLGAVPYTDRTRQALRTIAPTAPPASVEPVSPAPAPIRLTDRERDVLGLMTKGMSYAQIASELFITRKTVGYHLSNLYAKAGVTTRHQLADLTRHRPGLFVS
jgi:DNA-binding CsgD family transcriptional regulator